MKNISVFIALTCFVLFSASAQTGTEVKILYKDYPYLVTLDDQGEINYIVATALEVMNGQEFDKSREMPLPLGPYSRKRSADVALEEYISPNNSSEVGESDRIMEATTAAEETIVKKQVRTPARVDEKAVTEFLPENKKETEAVDFKTTVIRTANEKVDADYYLTFLGFSSRVTPQLTDLIRDISKEYAANPVKEVIINSFVTSGDKTNEELAEARMKSCYDLLETYGVPSSVMKTQIMPYQSDVEGNVSITFK